jgi:hypothetical protein
MNNVIEKHAHRFLLALHQRVNFLVPEVKAAAVLRLVEDAFRLYDARCSNPFEIAVWDWPFQELERDRPFEQGDKSWIILLREAYRLALRAHVSVSRRTPCSSLLSSR